MLSCLKKSPLKPKHNFLEKKGWDGQIPEEQEGEKSWQPRELILVKHSFRNETDVQCSQDEQIEEFIPVGPDSRCLREPCIQKQEDITWH